MAARLVPDSSCLIGIDVGTQSVRAIAFDTSGRKIAGAARPTPIERTPSGGEHDPDLIFATVVDVLAEVGGALAGRPVAGMAVASFGESAVLVDAGGKAVCRSIAWFDRRTEAEGRGLGEAVEPARLFAITGHAVDPTFTLLKLAWMNRQWPEAAARAKTVLMMADWIAFRLCGEAATDATLAARTLYFDLHRRRWSDELFARAGLAGARPAPLRPSGTALGAVRTDILAATGIAGRPVVGVGGHDHLVGSFAAGLAAPGDTLDSLGTAEALLLITAAPLADPEILRQGYLQGAIATDRQMSYLTAGIFSSGGAVEWLRGLLDRPSHAELIAEAEAVPVGSDGVVFLPHLGNAPPPTPDPDARGVFAGLAAGTSRGALFRAVLEGLAMQARLMIDGMIRLAGGEATGEIKVIGGGSRNRLFLTIKANAFARPLRVIDEPEATALGAALLGGLAAGLWPSLAAALGDLDRREHIVEPESELVERYADLRVGVFERLQPAFAPVNRDLARIAVTRRTRRS